MYFQIRSQDEVKIKNQNKKIKTFFYKFSNRNEK